MKTPLSFAGFALAVVLSMQPARAQTTVNSGSTGALGALVVSNLVIVPLPPDGKLHYTTVRIENGGILRFGRNPLNTPAYMLATGAVFIGGRIDVSGDDGGFNSPGNGGPGGFDGGMPGLNGPPGDGEGPGGGIGGYYQDSNRIPGSGSFATRGKGQSRAGYGNRTLDPLIGGCGGGGLAPSEVSPGAVRGGAGGGGAVLIASNSGIEFSNNGTGIIDASGGVGGGFGGDNVSGDGSGGGVRLVAPSVIGMVRIVAQSRGGRGGQGRIRIDGGYSPTSPELNGISRIGGNLQVFPSVVPVLNIIQVAGQSIPDGGSPVVQVNLSRSAPTNQTVRLRAKDFTGFLPVTVSVSPEQGPSARFVGEIDMSKNPPEVSIPIQLKPGAVNRVQAWTQ